MEIWRKVWRDGFAPHLSTAALEALRAGLAADDKALLQGATTQPPPLMCVQGWPCEGGCLTAYAGWKGEGLSTVGEVEQFFATVCFNADLSLGEPAACRWLLNWWDDTPRDEARRELLAEVEKALAGRAARMAGAGTPE